MTIPQISTKKDKTYALIQLKVLIFKKSEGNSHTRDS